MLSELTWISTCRTCGVCEAEPESEIREGREWKLASMWGDATTKKVQGYLYDGGPERAGWDCLREGHDATIGFVPIGYLPVQMTNKTQGLMPPTVHEDMH